MVPTVRGSQGIQKYHGAKVNKDAEKKTELLHAHCIQQFKIFSARFARRLFTFIFSFVLPPLFLVLLQVIESQHLVFHMNKLVRENNSFCSGKSGKSQGK